jgi:hypothetical protein
VCASTGSVCTALARQRSAVVISLLDTHTIHLFPLSSSPVLRLWPFHSNRALTDSVPVTMNYCFGNSICVSEQFYVHSTDDMPTIGRDKPHWEFRGFEQQVYVEQKQIVASPELRKLDPKQRGCLFRDEVKHDSTSAGTWKLPIYTYSLCKMACRSRMARSLCSCIPFFYRTIG